MTPQEFLLSLHTFTTTTYDKVVRSRGTQDTTKPHMTYMAHMIHMRHLTHMTQTTNYDHQKNAQLPPYPRSLLSSAVEFSTEFDLLFINHRSSGGDWRACLPYSDTCIPDQLHTVEC